MRYLDFALYHGFTPAPCRPYRAQTKGKVERCIGYIRQNFWVGTHFVDLDDLNGQAREWLASVANVRIHGTTGLPRSAGCPQNCCTACQPNASTPAG